MASLNVAEWTPDQVADWLSGLGPSVQLYVPVLRARGLDGRRLLILRCDDLETLGVHIIGHQELILEALEHLRNFHFEVRRECVQQLALRVAVVAENLARALRQSDSSLLDTQLLAEVCAVVGAVKPLVWWVSRLGAGGGAGLLAPALEAATCALRDRFADDAARTVHRAAAALAAAASYIIQDVSDPTILQPASLDCVTLKQGGKPLGFTVAPSCCGYNQVTDIRFGSPAHASGALHDGDEIVQVCGVCVVGWAGAAVSAACAGREVAVRVVRRAGGRARGLRRRARARPHPASLAPLAPLAPLASPIIERCSPSPPQPASPAPSSDSEPLSPPASPVRLHPDHTRMYPPKPRTLSQRRHTISCGSPVYTRPTIAIEQFWQELAQQRRWVRGGTPDNDDGALYARDKALSCSTGLERRPRPRELARGKLDKAHSTPAYSLERGLEGSIAAQPIPESPAADTHTHATHSTHGTHAHDDAPQITVNETHEHTLLLFEESPPSAVGAAALNPILSGRDLAYVDDDRECDIRADSPPIPPPRPPGSISTPTLSPAHVTHSPAHAILSSHATPTHVSTPVSTPTPALAPFPALRAVPPTPEPTPYKKSGLRTRASPPAPPHQSGSGALSPTGSVVRGIFPSSKTRSLKKKSSLLAKRRNVSWRTVVARGGVSAGEEGAAGAAGAAEGAVWQRVRGRRGVRPRWARRHLLLAHNLLYAYREQQSTKADCMISLEGFTVCSAAEVRSKQHAFKVYHTGTAFYFACSQAELTRAWIQLIHRATLLPSVGSLDPSKQFSETEYSTDSDSENPERRDRDREREKEREKDKSKFGSLRKLTGRGRADSHESVAAASLDRKYLRFFSRRPKDDKNKSKQSGVPVPTEHYRSYRRVADSPNTVSVLNLSSSGTSEASGASGTSATSGLNSRGGSKRIPKPINYIHASNPNLVDFNQTELARVAQQSIRQQRAAVRKQDNFVGFVTLEEFMLKKQEEERRQVYTNRVLMGIERSHAQAPRSLHERLLRIVPDVIYGELDPPHRDANRPVSVKGKDGYEKLVYPEELAGGEAREGERRAAPAPPAPPAPPRRPAKMPGVGGGSGSGSGAGSGTTSGAGSGATSGAGSPEAVQSPAHAPATPDSASGPGVSRLRLMFARPHAAPAPAKQPERGSPAGGGLSAVYPHLQCPPTFQPETYSLQRLKPPAHNT